MAHLWLLPGLYVAGVIWGLLVADARPADRVVLAILWPIGPIAFVVTVTVLLAASLIAFPMVGAVALLLVGGLVYSFCASA